MIYSIFIYFIAFFASIYLGNQYQKIYLKRTDRGSTITKGFVLFWTILIITPIVIIATLRFQLGTDYISYASMFYENRYTTVMTYVINILENNFATHQVEVGYQIIIRLARFLGNNHVVMFAIVEIIIITFVVSGIRQYQKKISVGFGLFVYFMVFFAQTLNELRSCIAVSIVFYAFHFLLNKKYRYYFLWIIIASFFHVTALIAIIFALFPAIKQGELSRFKKVFIWICIIFSPILIEVAFVVLPRIPVFSVYIAKYEILYTGGGIGFLIPIIPLLIPVLVFEKNISRLDKRLTTLIYIVLFEIPLAYAGYYIKWAARLTIFPAMAYIILIPSLVRSIKDRNLRLAVKLYYIVVLFAYYFIKYVLINQHQTYPYRIL